MIIKQTLIITLTLTLLSCNNQTNNKKQEPILSQKEQVKTVDEYEQFKEISSDDLNQQLIKKGENLSAKDIMKLFYPNQVETNEGNETINLSEKVSDNGNVIVTLIHDNMVDDSVKGEKYIMELTKTNNKWTVLSIKKNWKCWDGRGHLNWGIKLCN